jgi:hypothetical protein
MLSVIKLGVIMRSVVAPKENRYKVNFISEKNSFEQNKKSKIYKTHSFTGWVDSNKVFQTSKLFKVVVTT